MEPVKEGFRFPLSALIVRYFAYVLAGALALAGACLFAFGLMMASGLVLPANYGDTALDDTMAAIAEAGRVDDQKVPSSYWWAHFAADGALLDGDMPKSRLDTASEAAFEGLSIEYALPKTTQYETMEMPDGSKVVLVFEYLPQFTSKALRDALPNPQDLMLSLYGVLVVTLVVGIAVRAARVLQRKMEPLARAAKRIEAQDLAFHVGKSNVREIGDVLCAMERMRASLEESLEARWRAERQQRDQVAALAHDLKTPLTVVRGNVDMLLEAPLDDEARACARDAAAGADRLARTLESLVKVATSDAAGVRMVAGESGDPAARVDAAQLAGCVRRQAEALASAADVRLAFAADPLAGEVQGDADELERAVMNVIANAIEHAPAGSTVEVSARCEGEPGASPGMLVIAVRDEGPGFSPAGLAHACERFWQEDAARASAGHSGLGLHLARGAVERAGGTLMLANRPDACGAAVTLRMPLC